MSDKPQYTFVDFNVNGFVKAKVNSVGMAIHKARHAELCATSPRYAAKVSYKPLEVDSEGYTTFHVWEFMELFGPSLSLGSTVPFSDLQLKVRVA